MLRTINGDLHISLFHVERSPYQSLHLRDHTHPYWALSYVVEGHVITKCRGLSFEVAAGDIMIHPPGMMYSEIAPRAGVHEWLLLEARVATNVDFFRLYPIAPVVHIADPAQFSHTFQKLHIIWQNDTSALRWLHLFSLTTELLSLVFASWHEMGSVARPHAMLDTADRFAQVIDYMTGHLDAAISRQLLADLVGLHPVYFDRIFRENYGVPPMKMLREMRLHKAKELLENTNDTLETIAVACGLGNGSALVRLFQQKFAQTPGEYRQGLKLARKRYEPFL